MVAGEPQSILVVIPNWVGDVVLATPTLHSLRRRFPKARITFLLRRYVTEVIDGGGWHDELAFWPRSRAEGRALLHQLRGANHSVAILLTNSFRSAWTVWRGGARRRVGYARELRSWLLTDVLKPARSRGRFVPGPMLDYYAALAAHIGCPVTDRQVRLGITPAQEEAGKQLAQYYQLTPGQYVIINPGAAYGAAKCWQPEGFAAVIDALRTKTGLRSAIVGAPGEAPLMRRIAELSCTGPACCTDPGTTLGSLKPLVRDAALVVCNDTGPRHYGNAFGIPTVTIFGPTFQAWTDTGYVGEIKLQAEVPCGPCMKRVCPLDHRCMKLISPEQVVDAAMRLLRARPTNSCCLPATPVGARGWA